MIRFNNCVACVCYLRKISSADLIICIKWHPFILKFWEIRLGCKSKIIQGGAYILSKLHLAARKSNQSSSFLFYNKIRCFTTYHIKFEPKSCFPVRKPTVWKKGPTGRFYCRAPTRTGIKILKACSTSPRPHKPMGQVSDQSVVPFLQNVFRQIRFLPIFGNLYHEN